MKKSKLVGLAALLLSLGVVGCGENNGEGNKEEQQQQECTKHSYGDYTTTKDSTCKEVGSKERVCSVCGYKDVKEISKKSHSYAEVTEGENKSVAATCQAAGKKIEKCSNCGDIKETPINQLEHTLEDYTPEATDTAHVVSAATCNAGAKTFKKCSVCQTIVEQVGDPLGHDWVDAPATQQTGEGIKAATCTEAGKVVQVCSRAADCKEPSKVVDVPALGHAMEYADSVEAADGAVGYKIYRCANGDCKTVQYLWDAGDVSAASKATLKADGEGWKYGGHPINNGITNPSSDSHDLVPDKTVAGDFFEFTFKAPFTKSDAHIIADLKTQNYGEQTGVFSVDGNDGDWTPGIRFVDDGAGGEKAERIDDWRYIMQVTELGESENTAVTVTLPNVEEYAATDENVSSSRKVREFPGSFPITEGKKYTVKIIQAAGYESTFYSFGLETVSATKMAAHSHSFSTGPESAAPGYTTTKNGTCKCGLSAIQFDAGSFINSPTVESKSGGIRFNGSVENVGTLSQGKFVAPSEAKAGTDHWQYKINVTGAVSNVKILFDMAPSGSADVWKLGSDDATPGFVLNEDGSLTVSEIRYRILVNGVEIALNSNYADLAQKTSTRGLYEYPSQFNLKSGDNTIEIVRYAGHRAVFYGFALVY